MRKIFSKVIVLLIGVSLTYALLNACVNGGKAGTSAEYGQWQWTDVVLNGMGWMTGVVVCPEYPHQIYAKSDVGGVFKYDREAERWSQLLDSFGLDERCVYSVESIAVDPNDGNTLYFAGNATNAGGEIWKSADSGRTWQPTGLREIAKVYMGGNDDYRSEAGERLAVDPNNSGVLYFGSRRDGLWRKCGGGKWERITALPAVSDAPGFTYVAFDKNGGTVLVNGEKICAIFYVGAYLNADGTGASGVYKTTDGGMTFNKMTGTVDGWRQQPLRGAVNHDGVFITTAGFMETEKRSGILRGLRDGISLETALTAESGISGLSVSPDRQSFVALGTSKDNPIYFSDSNGQNWTQTNQRNGIKIPYQDDDWCHPERGGYIIDPADPEGRTAIAGTGFGIIKTTNLSALKTVVWDDHSQGISNICVNTVKAAPLNNGYDLHIAVLDMGGFSIENKNIVPQKRLAANNQGTYTIEWNIPLTGITGMDYSYHRPQYMAYAGWHEFGYYTDYALKFGTTTNGGRSWQEISIPNIKKEAVGLHPVESAGTLAMSSSNPNNIVYSPCGGFLKYSEDFGRTWHDASASVSAGVTSKFFMDDNRPVMYERVMPYWNAQNLASDKVNGNVFYLFTEKNSVNAEFWRSADGGKNWERTYTGSASSANKRSEKIDSLYLPFTNVRVNPVKEGDVFIAIRPGFEGEDSERPFNYKPLWRSTDKTCTDFKMVENVQCAIDAAFGKGDKIDTPFIYIYGKANGDDIFGVYVSTDDAQTWTRITNEQQQYGCVKGLEADMRYKNRVYLYTGGRGVICGEIK